jgi:hypothetical protein
MKDLMHEMRYVERKVGIEVINRVSYNVAGKVRREVEWKVPIPGGFECLAVYAKKEWDNVRRKEL